MARDSGFSSLYIDPSEYVSVDSYCFIRKEVCR